MYTCEVSTYTESYFIINYTYKSVTNASYTGIPIVYRPILYKMFNKV